MKPAVVVALLALAACDQPGSNDSESADATRNVPKAVRYDQYGSAANLAPPADDLVNPLGENAGDAAQGEKLFGAMNCAGCHGGGAIGFVGPSLVDGRWKYGSEDGALFHSIFYGRPHGMPAYGGLLSDTAVWQLVTYVQSQPVPGIVPTVAWQ